MNTILLRLPAISRGLAVTCNALVLVSCALVLNTGYTVFNPSYAQTAPPPNLGEETKGTPAIEESAPETDTTDNTVNAETSKVSSEAAEEKNKNSNIFGTSTVVESRRENGQVYSIELQHSNAPTQYIEETNSDGNIEFESKDVENTPNLPKWKLGSW